MRNIAAQSGLTFQADDDQSAIEEFAIAGMDLLDYQQNSVVNSTVRISFFVPDSALAKILVKPAEPTVRVATLEELFKTKCLVSAKRSKTRDWLDLYLLLRDHGFSIRDFQHAFQEAGVPMDCARSLSRLCSGVPQRDDEGYAHLLPNPPSLEQMKSYFIEQRNFLEIEVAADALRQRQTGDSDHQWTK